MFSNLPTPNRPVGKHTENAIFRALRDYFRIGGYSTGTENSRTERLDEYVGDCVNSRAFPATTGQVNECIALGGGRLLEIVATVTGLRSIQPSFSFLRPSISFAG